MKFVLLSLMSLGTLVTFLACSTTCEAQEEAAPQSRGEIQIKGYTHAYADNQGVKLHYVSAGEGPLVVMLHGFPDFWFTWRDQMEVLKKDFRVVAMDLRGYNHSGQPEGVENYAMSHLLDDVEAVIKDCGAESATVIGHDWGGAIAWQLAIQRPELVEQLIVCNITHPTGASAASLEALKNNGNKSYMDTLRTMTKDSLNVAWLSGWVKDPKARKLYVKAMTRSSVDGMLNYYRANTKDKQRREQWLLDPKIPELPSVKVPVMAIFGLKDQYVSKAGLNNTWDWVDAEFTLVTLPNAAHFVQQDESETVSRTIKNWLQRNEK